MTSKKALILAISAVALAVSLIVTISCSKSGWAVKIDDQTVSIDEFNKYYYVQNQMLLNLDKDDLDKLSQDPSLENHPTINKKRFMDFLISRILLQTKAKSDPAVDQDKLNAIIELSAMNAAATYLLTEKFKDEINVTDEEANAFYNTNKEIFKGVPIDENIVKKIKQQIFMQKLEKKSNEYIMELIAEAKVNREGFNQYIREQAKDSKKVKTTEPGESEVPAETTGGGKTVEKDAPQTQK